MEPAVIGRGSVSVTLGQLVIGRDIHERLEMGIVPHLLSVIVIG